MNKYGLILSSDGSKSSFEIGAWNALKEMKIDISAVSGSFVGALNAALIAQGDFERAVRFWCNVSSKNLFGVNRHIAVHYTDEWSKSDTRTFKRSFIKYIRGRSEELDPLRETLSVYISEEKIRKSKTDFGFVSVSANTLEAEVLTLNKIPNGKLIEYLLIATCFPQIIQVNRAEDPQFSTLYSPYRILTGFGANKILSTDEVIVIPPDTNADIKIIRAGEAMEFRSRETMETMKKNIKMGYVDTLRIFTKSKGSIFYITDSTNEKNFDRFRSKLGSAPDNYLYNLICMLLRLPTIKKSSVQIRLAQMLKASGVTNITNANFELLLLENLAKILQIPRDEKYTLDSLIETITSRVHELTEKNKVKFTNVSYIRELMSSVVEPGKNLPHADLFIEYYILLMSSKPSSYQKLAPFVGYLHLQTLVAIVTLIYLVY